MKNLTFLHEKINQQTNIFSFCLSLSLSFLFFFLCLSHTNFFPIRYVNTNQIEFFYVESDFPALNYTEFVMRNNAKAKTAKNVEMFQYIGVNNQNGGG